MEPLPDGLVVFGPAANCTLDLCPIEYSVYRYRPALPASITFIALFAVAAVLHAYLGLRWRQFGFMGCMLAGCVVEIVGYAGRVVMHGNPFGFGGFMTQVVCITIGPVFYTAAIYITLSKTIAHYSPSISRLRPPSLYYWIFLPADIVCLILQAAGGALSTDSSGSNDTGIDLALAGLALQVVVIVSFLAFFSDHMVRYFIFSRRGAEGFPRAPRRMYLFVAGLYGATLLILARCAFRCYELKDGYGGDAVADEGLFIGLEGVLVAVAAFALGIGHPGLVEGRPGVVRARTEKGSATSSSIAV